MRRCPEHVLQNRATYTNHIEEINRMEEETTLSPTVDLVTLLDQRNDLSGNDARAVFTIIRQILSIVEQPILSDIDNGTLLET